MKTTLLTLAFAVGSVFAAQPAAQAPKAATTAPAAQAPASSTAKPAVKKHHKKSAVKTPATTTATPAAPAKK